MSPEQIKDVFTKMGDFQKPKTNPITRLLAMGIINYEGEKWAKHRKIINPAFHLEKLKVIYYITYPFKSMWKSIVVSRLYYCYVLSKNC